MSAMHSYANRYRETAIKTANPVQLIVILYDGAIQALQEAQEHLKNKNIQGRASSTNKAVSIISELQASLNFRVGGEIAPSLNRLYNYMKQRIFRANVEQKAEPLHEVANLLGNLRAAWGEVAAQPGSGSEKAIPASAPLSSVFNSAAAAPMGRGALNISG